MAAPVPFTGNVQDLSNYNGFQWGFHCNRCGNGFRSSYEQNVVSRGQEMLRMAGRFFGGPVETVWEGVDEFNAYSGGGASQSGMKERAFSERGPTTSRPLYCNSFRYWWPTPARHRVLVRRP